MPSKSKTETPRFAATLQPGQAKEADCANCGPILITNTTKGEYVVRAGSMVQCPLCAPLKTFGVPKNGLRAEPRLPQ